MVIELAGDIMLENIVTKFGVDWIRMVRIRERTKSISTNFTNKGVITPNCLRRPSCILN